MSDAIKTKHTWLGLVCPVCRFVFRVPKSHEGNGVICPACKHLLSLPEEKMDRKTAAAQPEAPSGETKTLPPKPRKVRDSKPIVARPLSEEDKLTNAPAERRVRRRRSRSKSQPEWDKKPSSQRRGEGSATPWIIGGSAFGLLLVGVGAWIVFDSLEEDVKTPQPPTTLLPPLSTNDLDEEPKVELTPEEMKRQEEIRASVKTGMSVLTEAETVVKKFLNATSVEEMGKYVRTPSETVPRMQKWYSGKPWKTTGVKKVGVGGRVTVKGVMASMSVQLDDYSYRQIALERVGNEYKVDWESWIVWSSMPWEELFEKKPEQPVEIRVQSFLDNYYNRYFRDDSKWVAVRLMHPYKERTLYGYIDRKSPLMTRLLADLQGTGGNPTTLKVKYPKNALAQNQVEITEYIQNGWVRPVADESSTEPETPSPGKKP